MNQIIEEANIAAKSLGYVQKIIPVKKEEWKRSYTLEKVGHLEIPLIGVLTSPESCVIEHYRSFYAMSHMGCQLATSMFLTAIAEKIGLEDASYTEVIAWLNSPESITQAIQDGIFTVEEVTSFKQTFVDIQNNYKVEEARKKFEALIIDFFITMRVDPDWQHSYVTQLSEKEQQTILKLIYQEEGGESSHQDETNLKKK